MKLLYSNTSPFARKCRVVAIEVGISDRVENVMTIPVDPASGIDKANPLNKIPALIQDDGEAIYDSPVICEYLDELGNGTFFPRARLLREAQGRWRALTLQALGDGLADAVVRRNQERRLPEGRRSEEVLERQTRAIEASFAALDRIAAKFPAEPTIGELAVACAIGYLDLRVPEDGWRTRYPRLAAWLEAFSQRPSVQATKPPPA